MEARKAIEELEKLRELMLFDAMTGEDIPYGTLSQENKNLYDAAGVANEAEQMAKDNGGAYAQAKLMQRAGQITGVPIVPVHEEEMRKARLANEAEGIFFPPDDPDIW